MKATITVLTGIFLGLLGFNSVVFAEESEGVRMQYKIGDGLKIGDGSSLVYFQARVQGRYTYNALDQAVDNNTWAIQRGKIKIDGFTLAKKLGFGFQMNLATRSRASTTPVCTDAGCTKTANAVTTESTTGLAVLEDFYADWVPAKNLGIKIGQYKVPFLLQELTSSGKQQFVDRSLATGVFNLTRDIGVTLHGGLWGVDYALFAMNGDGMNVINRNKSMMAGARVEFPILGTYQWSESDTDHSESPNLGLGIAYAFNKSESITQSGTMGAGVKASSGTMDLGYKYKGFSFQGSGMIGRSHTGPTVTNGGYNGQVGYFLLPKRFELAARTSGVIFSKAVNQYEHALSLNYFIMGHGIKLQTDYAFLQNSRGRLDDHRIRTQMQVVF